jgi:2-hydroxyglutarate dehydrogenase
VSDAERDVPVRCDTVVVGAGIVGLAVARELLARRPGSRVVVLDREREVGLHQTARNSGVVHAGVYYAPGSLKARLCVEGARELYAYCEQRGVAHERCGKLIVALDESELPALDELERRGRANGVPGLRRVDAAGLRELEPEAAGVAALHSPQTGIVDFPGVARALAADVEAAGGKVVLGCEVRAVRDGRGEVVVAHARGETVAQRAIACAGGWSDRLAVASGAPPDPRIVPFRGAYLRLRPERRSLVRSLIYPVPDPALPFLGVHFTRHVSGDVLVGPTALLVPRARSLAWPGTWRMARRFWRTGVHELSWAVSRRAYAREAARYVPALEPGDLEPAFSGVRAQALSRDGRLLDDFTFSVTGRVLHVRNAPSPAATSALGIARHVVQHFDDVVDGLGR